MIAVHEWCYGGYGVTLVCFANNTEAMMTFLLSAYNKTLIR